MLVSFTSFPGNMMEQILIETVSRLVKDWKVIGNSQHGCIKEKTFLTNLPTFYDDCLCK